MATDPIDPVEEEVRRVLADPTVQSRLDAFEERVDRGELRGIPHNEARRVVGLPPLPEHD
jgi:hypothetical protein